jgi:hypothetical protein
MCRHQLILFSFIFCSIFSASTVAAQQEGGKLSLLITPGITLPLGAPADTYSIGFGAEVAGIFSMPFAPWLIARAGIDYSLSPISELSNNLNTLTLSGGAGVHVTPLPWLGLYATGMGGYYLSFFSGQPGGSVFVGGEGGVEFYLAPAFGIGAGISYRHYFTGIDAFYQGLKIHVGAIVRLGMGKRKPNIEIYDIRFNPIFPVFYKYYDDHDLGTVSIRNGEGGTIEDVKVSFYVPQYMDRPKRCEIIKEMKKGEIVNIPLYALFTDNVLGITEGTKINTQIITEYTYANTDMKAESSKTLRLYDRNAMTWDDDRKAAAFVTAKAPHVLKISKNVAGMVREHRSKAINLNFRIALAIFEALSLHGINYVVDPQTPYEEFSKKSSAIDYLQFPIQTIEYKAGDCDDISILYAAMLESTGIETAFITIPGHIFVAFNLNMPPEDAKKLFLNPADLIFYGNTTWLPVEITMIQDGFLQAWKMGAKEWREHKPKRRADFFPVHKAWKEYEPVGFAFGSSDIPFPAQEKIMDAYTAAVNRFVERESAEKVAALQKKISSSQNPSRFRNKLGVLYARYGIMDKAKAQFEIAAKWNYTPALINLGNILFLEGLYERAVDMYEKANELRTSPAALLGIAKASYELENHGTVKRTYEEIRRINPDLAERFSYLVSSESEDTGRASAAMIRETVVWEENSNER